MLRAKAVANSSIVSTHQVRWLLLALALVLTNMVWIGTARAEATATCGLMVEIIAAPFAVVDSNKPGVEGPMVGTMGARITNTSGATVTGVSTHIGNGTTPGAFTSASGGNLSLLEASDATHFMGDLAPGKSVISYWPLTYPPTYDVSYPYSVWANNVDGCSASASTQLTTQSEISATANKLQPTGGMIVTSPSSAAPGGTLSVKIIGFELGTIGQGPRPLSPTDAWLQPIGNLSYDPTCFRLVESEVLLTNLSSTPFQDRLYFSGIGKYNSSPSDYVEYTFLALRHCSTAILPYQEAASGTQEKYNADYSTNVVTLQTGGNTSLQLSLSGSSATLAAGGTVDVTASVSTDSGLIGYPDSGSPVVVTSTIPDGTSYLAGSTESTALATIQYSTDGGTTWLNSEPADASTVTDIRWILQDPVDGVADDLTYSLQADPGYDGSTLLIDTEASLLNAPALTSNTLAINGTAPEPTPTPTPDPATEVQSGGSGGLESGPLEGDPSLFLGGIGADEGAQAASLQQAQILHEARLLQAMSLKVEDLMPENGPVGTTPQEAVPVDVLAVTTAPDATGIDFVDGDGKIRAVALGINSVGGPYEHDYGVCNRFKTYSFENIEPLSVPVTAQGIQGNYWFWHAVSTRGSDIREDAFIFHIFVDEASKTFHIDSRWIMNDYPKTFDFDFDYVFNMQLWSAELANSQDLLNRMLDKMVRLDGGSWDLVFHNQAASDAPQVFIESTAYRADNITVTMRNVSAAEQNVRLYGIWRNQVNRNESRNFEYNLTLAAGETAITLPFPGLLDVTMMLEHGAFRDKVYTGGGLWFDFANDDVADIQMDLPQCRQLEEIDTQDLMLAGCVDLTGSNVTAIERIGVGRTLNPNGRPVDVSPYQALRFWTKGEGVPVRVVLETASVTDNDHYQTTFTPDAEWRQYIIPLAEFTQRGFGEAKTFTGTDVKAVIWTNAGLTGGDVHLSVDQVSFTNKGLMIPDTVPADTAATDGRTVTVIADDGAAVTQMSLFYSLDDGATFQSMPLVTQDQTQFAGQIPGQELGTDVLFYIAAEHTNGYESHSPIDAPASLYRYRVDDRAGLLVDDFAGERLANRRGGKAGVFNSNTAGGSVQVYRVDQTLMLDYDVRGEGQLAGYFTLLNGLDATAFTTLNLLVRGTSGGEQLLVGLRDGSNHESRVSVGDVMDGGIAAEWRWVQIPLNAFAGELDRAALQNISFAFKQGAGSEQGRVAVREVRFTGLTTAVVVDRFDDGNDLSNGQGVGYTLVGDNATLDRAYVANDGEFPSGRALRLDYNVQQGGYALWISPLRSAAVADHAVLAFRVNGGAQALEPHIYLGDGTTRARVNLSDYAAMHGAWEQVRIPAQAFAQQGVDLSRVKSVEIAFEFGTGQGTLLVDDIAFEVPGNIQAERRVLHMNDRDLRTLALHVSGGEWRAASDAAWLTATSFGSAPASVEVYTVNFGLQPGEYAGQLVFTGENGASETVSVHLSVTEETAPAQRIFLPLVTER